MKLSDRQITRLAEETVKAYGAAWRDFGSRIKSALVASVIMDAAERQNPKVPISGLDLTLARQALARRLAAMGYYISHEVP